MPHSTVPALQAVPYSLQVARGLVTGVASLNKFGRNTAIASAATEDIWDGGGIWVAPTVSRTHALVSTDDNDGKTGAPSSTGARTIRIYGLTSFSLAEVTEDITLDGTTPVNTVNTYGIIHRMKVLTSGATAPNIGTITATAATDGTVTAQINPSQGQTQMAIYGIPSTQKLYLSRYYCDVNKSAGAAGGVDVSLHYNPAPGTQRTIFLVKHTVGVLTTGTSHISHNFIPYNEFEGPGILKIQTLSGFNTADVSAGFEGYLIDN